jgi:hypothetical protein
MSLHSGTELVVVIGVVSRHLAVVPGKELTSLPIGVRVILRGRSFEQLAGQVPGQQRLGCSVAVQQHRCMPGGDPGTQPRPVGSELSCDMAVRRPTGLEDEAALITAQLENDGFDQPPTVIGEDLSARNPASEKVALLGTEPAQFIRHGKEDYWGFRRDCAHEQVTQDLWSNGMVDSLIGRRSGSRKNERGPEIG